MPLDLVIPHLLLPPDAPPRLRAARFPAIERWLARADTTEEPGGDAMRWIARAHGVPEPYAMAAIARRGEGGAAGGPWLRADPVHLRVSNDDLVLHDASILGLELDEARELADALNAGISLPTAWPSRCTRPPAGTCEPRRARSRAPCRSMRRSAAASSACCRAEAISTGPGLLTEAQMVLAESHPANAAREPAKPAVTSVWFWGEGIAPEKIAHRYDAIHAQDPFARGIAALSGAKSRPAPADFAGLESGDSHVLVVDWICSRRRLSARRRGCMDRRRRGASRKRWFEDLGNVLARSETVRIVLPSEKRTRVAALTPASRWRWLRTRKPLAAHA